MATCKKFEDLEIWQSSRLLVKEVRTICTDTKAKSDFSFVDQITRSSRSVSANIAEGFEAGSPKYFIQFLRYAKRSASEVRSHLYDALDEKYISQKKFTQLTNDTDTLCKRIGGLISYLNKLQ